jgi:hypothetical protein
MQVVDNTTGQVPEIATPAYTGRRANRHEVQIRPVSAGTLKLQRVPMCGHKFTPGQEPRHRNCESCWFTFFQVHGELTQSLDEVFAKYGESGLRHLKPAKYVKNFLRFMSTIATWKEAAETAKEHDVEEQTEAAA